MSKRRLLSEDLPDPMDLLTLANDLFNAARVLVGDGSLDARTKRITVEDLTALGHGMMDGPYPRHIARDCLDAAREVAGQARRSDARRLAIARRLKAFGEQLLASVSDAHKSAAAAGNALLRDVVTRFHADRAAARRMTRLGAAARPEYDF